MNRKQRSAPEHADIYFARETTGDGVVTMRSLADAAPKDGPAIKFAQHLGPLAEAGTDGLTQDQLGERWAVSKSSTSSRINALIKGGLARRSEVAGSRSTRLYITEAGIEAS